MFYLKSEGRNGTKIVALLAGSAKSVYQICRYFERELALLVDIHVL
jgi:hypothetical protein